MPGLGRVAAWFRAGRRGVFLTNTPAWLARKTGSSTTRSNAQPSSAGDQTLKVPFGKGAVRYVVIVLTNTSIRYLCWQGSDYACLGDPRDDNLSFAYKAKAIR